MLLQGSSSDPFLPELFKGASSTLSAWINPGHPGLSLHPNTLPLATYTSVYGICTDVGPHTSTPTTDRCMFLPKDFQPKQTPATRPPVGECDLHGEQLLLRPWSMDLASPEECLTFQKPLGDESGVMNLHDGVGYRPG